MKRLLIVTETGEAWPSAFVRAHIYRELFRRDGIEVSYLSRLDPTITKLLERPPRSLRRLVSTPFRRLLRGLQAASALYRESRILGSSARSDVIYLQKVGSPDLVRRLRASTKARLVYDLNDGLWLPSRASFAQGRIEEILRSVDAITCDNPHGQVFARERSPSSYLVPDPAQVEAFDARRPGLAKAASPIVIGWIGSRGTAFNLFLIWEALERVFEAHSDITLRILGTGSDLSVLPPFEKVRYSLKPDYTQQEMIDEVSRMHIGLFPLFDTEDSLARGFLKAEIYMSGEAALITSPVGQSLDLVRDGVNGMLAGSPAQWQQKLGELIREPALRARIARAGLETVREHFSLEVCYAALKEALFPANQDAGSPGRQPEAEGGTHRIETPVQRTVGPGGRR